MKILITGCAGFIGFHVAIGLKEARLEQLRQHDRFHFNRISLENYSDTEPLFRESDI